MKIRLTAAMAALTLAACGGSGETDPTAVDSETSVDLGVQSEVLGDENVETTAPELIETEPTAQSETGLLMPLPSATTSEITEEDLRIRIKTLSDDVFEGRGPGTPAGENSAQWIADEMHRIGLTPGNDGSFMQTVEMVELTIDSVSNIDRNYQRNAGSRRTKFNCPCTDRRHGDVDEAPEC